MDNVANEAEDIDKGREQLVDIIADQFYHLKMDTTDEIKTELFEEMAYKIYDNADNQK